MLPSRREGRSVGRPSTKSDMTPEEFRERYEALAKYRGLTPAMIGGSLNRTPIYIRKMLLGKQAISHQTVQQMKDALTEAADYFSELNPTAPRSSPLWTAQDRLYEVLEDYFRALCQ